MQATEFTENTEIMRASRIFSTHLITEPNTYRDSLFFSVNSVFSVANCFFWIK